MATHKAFDFEGSFYFFKWTGKGIQLWKTTEVTFCEYPGSTVEYNRPLDQAVFLMTMDTGATMWHLSYAGARLNKLGYKHFHSASDARWIGNQILAHEESWNLRQPTENRVVGTSSSSLNLIDPFTGKRRKLKELISRWPPVRRWEAAKKLSVGDYDPRTGWLAYCVRSGGRWVFRRERLKT